MGFSALRRTVRSFSSVLFVAGLLASLGLAGCATAPKPLTTSAATAGPFMDCRGKPSARPTIVLEAGSFGTSADWVHVLKALSHDGLACAYDRDGLGRSADTHAPRDAVHIAQRLAALLDAIDETRPIILVGHSNGAFYAQTFATLYPDRVAGLGYIDGVNTSDLDDPRLIAGLRDEANTGRWAIMGARLGLGGGFIRGEIAGMGLEGDAARHKEQALRSAIHLANSEAEAEHIVGDLSAVRALGKIPASIPIAVVVATYRGDDALDPAWRAAQVAAARGACQAFVIEALGATHTSVLARDKSYVLSAIDWLATPGLGAPGRACVFHGLQ
jgi:pimeloyl-ACP methyl ester carboxylesterase